MRIIPDPEQCVFTSQLWEGRTAAPHEPYARAAALRLAALSRESRRALANECNNIANNPRTILNPRLAKAPATDGTQAPPKRPDTPHPSFRP